MRTTARSPSIAIPLVSVRRRLPARLRADLRTVPAVRAALEGSGLAMALEVLTIESLALEDRALRLKIGLPVPFGAP